MLTEPRPIAEGRYSHDLLLHDTDHDLVAATHAFVERGLASGGQVLVHSSEERVALLREAVGTHPRLEYGLDRDLYLSPSSTLFAYERKLASEDTEMWVTGTVPLGDDPAEHPAWTRYESMVNEVLGGYAFHALCTYDTRILPARTIAAAKAAHPGVSTGGDRSSSSADYLHPAAFLSDPLAGLPEPPTGRPLVSSTVLDTRDLRQVRRLVVDGAAAGAMPRDTVDAFVVALNEVLANALTHGAPPVELAVWVGPSKLAARVTDAGPGIPDTLSGYHYPAETGPTGLWVARQLCEEVIVSNQPHGGCSVLVATA